MHDVYTDAFYEFERKVRAAFEPAEPVDMSMLECVDLALRAFEMLGHPPHVFSFSEIHPEGLDAGACTLLVGNDSIEGDPNASMFVLGFPIGRRRPWCVLHECAHALRFSDGHGPMFAKTCIALWTTLGGWSLEDVMRLATSVGIAIA